MTPTKVKLSTKDKGRFPESDKLLSVQGESTAQGAFLDWLLNRRAPALTLCRLEDEDEADGNIQQFVEVFRPIQSLLAEYHEIDMEKVEKERKQILKEFESHAKR